MYSSPDVVNYYIPLMKELNMGWGEIKNTPRHELRGLVIALNEFNILHSFDGYSKKSVVEMQKDDPSVAQAYADYMERKRKFNFQKTEVKSFTELL